MAECAHRECLCERFARLRHDRARCPSSDTFQRHDISRRPAIEGDKAGRKTFKAYPIVDSHVGIAEVRTEQGKLLVLVAIDRTSKLAFVELHGRVSRRTAADFLRRLTEELAPARRIAQLRLEGA